MSPLRGADLVGGGQDVGQQYRRVTGDLVKQQVSGGVGERYADVLGLSAVDPVTEDPPTAAESLLLGAGAAPLTEAARVDAGHQHPVAGRDRWSSRRLAHAHLLIVIMS